MSGPKAGSAFGSVIPASDRKLVSSLKEIVPNSEEEIYAMLKECNRDPDETAQRLLSEGKFLIVKSKRDKKKENASNKESSDARSRPSSLGPSGRSTKTNGASRGNSLPKSTTNEVSGGRGRITAKENGISHSSKGSSSASMSSSYLQPVLQHKGSATNTTSSPLGSSSPQSYGDLLHTAPLSNLQGAWLAGSGSSTLTIPQGAWLAGSRHPTMADVLKSSSEHLANPLVSIPLSVSVSGSVAASTSNQQLQSVPSVSGVYLDASDPVLSPSLDPRARSSVGVVKREVGTVGNQRLIGDRPSSFELSDGSADSSPLSTYSQLPQVNNTSVVSAPDGNRDVRVLQSMNSPVSPTSSLRKQLECVQSLGTFPGSQGHSLGMVESSRISTQSPSRAGLLGSQFITTPMYQAQQFAGNQKVMDWNSESTTDHDVSFLEIGEVPSASVLNGVPSCPPSPSGNTGMIAATATKLQELLMQDDQRVIIPDHLRVSEADCTRLSFGSFDSGFETFPSSFTLEAKSTSLKVGGSTVENEAAVAGQPPTLSVPSTNSSTLDQHQSATVEILDGGDDSAVSSNPIVLVSQSELTKSEPTSQHSLEFIVDPSYRGVNLISPNHAGQYAIESEPRPQDINRLSSVLQPYSDPTATYYSGAFRSVPDIENRYSTVLPSPVGARYITGGSVGTGQNTRLQESANATILSSSNPLSQPLQSPTAMTVPQHSLPVHAYAAQPSSLPMGPFANVFSYQYVPPGFSYLQSPYQHNYTGTGGYQQVPSVGATTVKYPVPQYKPRGTVGAGMHNAVATGMIGYGGFSNSQPGTESNLYIHGQQKVEGSAMWLQAQLSREMPGVQGNSYHNIPGQNQQTRYSQMQSLHAHSHLGGAYGSLYHPQQSALNISSHQSLQQPQVMGSGGVPGTQVESYQQGQRGQQNWTNGF